MRFYTTFVPTQLIELNSLYVKYNYTTVQTVPSAQSHLGSRKTCKKKIWCHENATKPPFGTPPLPSEKYISTKPPTHNDLGTSNSCITFKLSAAHHNSPVLILYFNLTAKTDWMWN